MSNLLVWRGGADVDGSYRYIASCNDWWVGYAYDKGEAIMSVRMNNAGFPDKQLATQAEAKQYIEECFAVALVAGVFPYA